MSMSTTYLTKGSDGAVYDTRVKQLRFTAADYPLTELLAAALPSYLTLAESYAGASVNPFMLEAFLAAANHDHMAVFKNDTYPENSPIYARVAARFGIKISKFEESYNRLREALPNLNAADLAYYTATIFLVVGGRWVDGTGTVTRANNAVSITNTIVNLAKSGKPALFSGEKLALLNKAYADLASDTHAGNFARSLRDKTATDFFAKVSQIVTGLAAFETKDLRHIMTTLPPEQWHLPGRVMRAMGCKNYAEVDEIIQSISLSILEGLLPAE